MAKIIITGSTGYIGLEVVKCLKRLEPDCEIFPIGRDTSIFDTKIDFEVRSVVHLATLSSSSDSEELLEPMFRANLLFGTQLLNWLDRNEQKNTVFINTGSFAEYRLGVSNGFQPAYLYTATKTAFRSILNYYKAKGVCKVITAVPYTVYGGHDRTKKIINYLADALDAKQPVSFTKGEQVLDFVHVQDVALFFAQIALQPQALAEGTYHLGTGIGTSVRTVAEMLEKMSGKRLNANWGGLPYRPLDVMTAVAPENKTLEAFWKPKISIEQGLREYL